MSKILIVEDEESIADLEKDYLELSGFEVEVANDGQTGLDKALFGDFDLVILDLMLPGVDGFEICRKVRAEKNTPIIMVSAKKDDIDKIRGLGLGADDYMTKPFGLRELLARVKANLRRTNAASSAQDMPDVLTFGDLSIMPERYEVTKNGKVIDLTFREFELLKFLATQKGKIFSRESLLNKVWDYEFYGDVRTVDVTVRRLREKIEDEPSQPKFIMTKRGVGYYFHG